MERLLSTAEAAKVLSASPALVRRLVNAGVLPVVRYGPTSRLRFRETDLAEILKPRRRAAR